MYWLGVIVITFAFSGCSSVKLASAQHVHKFAPEIPFESFNAYCETPPTNSQGERDDCHKTECRSYPGLLIAQATVKRKIDRLGTDGEEPRCDLSFNKYVEVVRYTGISDPAEVCVTAFIRSPGGLPNHTHTGHITCNVSGKTYQTPIFQPVDPVDPIIDPDCPFCPPPHPHDPLPPFPHRSTD